MRQINLNLIKWLIISIGFVLVSLCGIPFTSLQATDNEVLTIINDLGINGQTNSDFINSESPWGAPFGSRDDFIITARFNDLLYFETFKKWHKGLDLIPSPHYYNSDLGYLTSGEVIMYATCNGKAKSMKDEAGALYVSLLCNDNVHEVFLVHNKINLLPFGGYFYVNSGMPIAIMGSTGKAYGEHVHYGIRNVTTGEYFDPELYIP